MSATITITPKMQEAIDYMRSKDGTLNRYPGGFWASVDGPNGYMRWNRPNFGTSTVEALVRRGLADYTDWRDGRNGRFPVAVTLKEPQP